MEQGMIFDIKRFAVHDGPGIRTTVFFKGCPLHCCWCHNPEGISSECELMQREITLDDRKFVKKEQVGRKYTVEQLLAEIERDRVFYEVSGGGVTFSGGEPLLQAEFLLALLRSCQSRNIHTTLDTCGYTSEEVLKTIIPYVDLFLYDIKMMDESKHLEHTGVSNRQILKNLNIITEIGKEVIIRYPLIPGFTDSINNAIALVELLENIGSNWKIHLLPFHNTAGNKYKKLGLTYILKETKAEENSSIEQLVSFFQERGMETKLGG